MIPLDGAGPATVPVTPPIPPPAAVGIKPAAAAVIPTTVIVSAGTLHTIKAGDTFQSISTDHYGNPNWANALKAYVQQDMAASPVLRSGELRPDLTLYIPPTTELERVSAVNPAAPAPTPVTPTVQSQKYRVAQGGEMMLSIGERTLPGPNGWMEIKKLNPTIDPEKLVPEGTILVMPASAQIRQ
jgi:nucleoid-associated protein YgaU